MSNNNSIHQNNTVNSEFNQIPKGKNAFLIWRVENMKLNLVPKESYGDFFKGDTYLIYYASYDANKVFNQHIHLWIGSETTNDEQGVGAFKMVELDEYLGGTPIQHRECQNYESERFLNYFKQKGGIKYQNGGVASGFNHYEKKLDSRLFQIRGKRNIRLNELYNLDWTSLNRNDSFIMDFNTTVFVWNGRNTIKNEKIYALNKARQIREERNGNCNIVIVEDGEEKEMSKEEIKIFESKFPLKEKVTKLKNDPPPNVNDDLKFEKDSVSYLKLYRCTDARDDEDGTVKIKIIEQKTGPLYREDLNSEDSFIIDNGKNGIWVWIGKKSNVKERQEAMRNALGFLQAKGFDERQQNEIKVTRVIDGSEPVEFRALFNRWTEKSDTNKNVVRSYTMNNSANSTTKIAKTVQTKFDASVLHSNPAIASDLQMVDDGKGFKEIWFVQNFELHKLDETKYGEFHSGDCYLIHYKYFVNLAEKHILYYWIGRKSTADEQGTLALKTIELDNTEFDGNALQVRVNEGKEPNHFMAIFDGKILIYQGGRASAFNKLNGAAQSDTNIEKLPENYMLQIKSFSQTNVKAIQVDYRASSLNSNDVFIICFNNKEYFVWCGKGSTGDEREAAKKILLAQKKEPEIIIESQEKEEFWTSLGGKETYYSDKRLQYVGNQPIARLFALSNSSGRINVNEIFEFNQDDLNPSDVMILDAWDNVYIWVGSNSNKQEREESERITIDYLKNCPSQRGTDIPIYKIKQGQEPPIFTGFFGPWDPELFKPELDYNTLKSELQSKNQSHLYQVPVKEKAQTNGSKPLNDLSNFERSPKYSYDQLIKPIEELPKDVITEFRELHLNDDEFQKIFKMTYQQFIEKPIWKQKELKRGVALF